MSRARTDRILRDLNPAQREAVETVRGPVLALAGAGSGKTRVITVRIAYLLEVKKVPPESILGVTFTNKAAKEMRDRLAVLVGKPLAAKVTVSTFHAFCAKVLRKEIELLGYGKHFTILDESDQRSLLNRIVREEGSKGETYDSWIFASRISRVKNALVEPDESGKGGDKYEAILRPVYESYREALRARNALDFDDLITLTLRLFEKHKDVRKRYRDQYHYLLVDEYQDTNHAQFLLVKALAGAHKNVCVVGDDDQSIYGWRGAEVDNILRFDKQFPRTKVIRLEQNYRSTNTILSAANSVIESAIGRRPKRLWSDRGNGRLLDGVLAEDELDEAKTVVDRLLHQKSVTGLPFREFAVLYRSNVQSRPFETALRVRKVPFVVIGGMEFFDRKEVRDLIAYLRVIQNPWEEGSLRRVINVPRRGVGDRALLILHEESLRRKEPLFDTARRVTQLAGLSPVAERGIASFIALLDSFRSQARKKKPSQLLRGLVEEIRYKEEIFSTEKDEKRALVKWDMVEELVNAAAGYESQEKRPTLERFLETVALDRDVDRAEREKRFDQDAVRLMTIHSAKGLEFAHVFLVGMEEGILPHQKCMTDGASLNEERRLCYVAITRARDHLTFSLAKTRRRYGKEAKMEPSRFLKEIPDELLRKQYSGQPYTF